MIKIGDKFIKNMPNNTGQQIHRVTDILQKDGERLFVCEWGVFTKRQQILTEKEINYWIEKYSSNFKKTVDG